MAKLKATPKNFVEAQAVLGTKSSVRLGNNTFLERTVLSTGQLGIVVRLHNTNIVVFHHTGRVTLHTGGYRTTITKERINQFINGRVFAYKGEWKIGPVRWDGSLDMAAAIPFDEGHRAA